MPTIKHQFLSYLKTSLFFQNLLSDQQVNLLKMIETASEEKLMSSWKSLESAEEKFKADQEARKINIEEIGDQLSGLNNQLKALTSQELKLDEEEENEKAQIAAEDALKQLDSV
jgi:hypothetical protein